MNKSYVEKTMQKANKRAIDELSGEEKAEDTLLWQFDEEPEISIEDGGIWLNSKDTPIGYISVDAVPDSDTQIELVEIVVKQLNKFKSLLESLK